MKNNVRRALAISGLAIAIGTSGVILNVHADTGKNIQRSHEKNRAKKMETFSGVKTGRRIIPGTVTEIKDSALTVVKGDKTFTVNVDSATRVLNKHWKTASFSDIKTGDKVRVFGSISGTVITAKTLRILTLQ